MNNDYLWDGTGEPDPEVQKLERLLSEFRSDRPAPSRAVRPRWTAIAAAVALATAGAWLATRTVPESWTMAVEGSGPGRLAVGETLDTGAGRATVNIGDIGVIEVAPNSRLRLIRARKDQHRISLERGLIHARIWAPPRSFMVDTPSAVATDLGCAYTLEVGADGAGLVRVSIGWVSFEREGRESFIPAGAACQTRPAAGPGTPYREDASAAFRQALQEFDFAHGGDRALDAVLAEATAEDAFSLWHLLGRCPPGQAGRVYDALAHLVAPPDGVTREGVLRGNRRMLDSWWDKLGLGDTDWWRLLEGKWPG